MSSRRTQISSSASVVSGGSGTSHNSGLSSVSGSQSGSLLLSMDAGEEDEKQDPDAAFWRELRQVLAGEQLGRQFRRVLVRDTERENQRRSENPAHSAI